MRIQSSKPFKVHFSELWSYSLDGITTVPFKEDTALPSWKGDSSLRLSVKLSWSDLYVEPLLSLVNKGMELALSAKVFSITSSGSYGTNRIKILERVGLTRERILKKCIAIQNNISGENFSNALELVCYLTVIHDETGTYKDGEIIWKTDEPLQLFLSGDAPSMNVSIISFSNTPYPPGALFFVKRNNPYVDLEEDFLSSYTLFLNEDHPLCKVINSDDENSLEAIGLRNWFTYEFYKTILEDILSSKDIFNSLISINKAELKTRDNSCGDMYVSFIEEVFGNSKKDMGQTLLSLYSNKQMAFLTLQSKIFQY